ncbi:MAG: hypothetical protein A3K08_01645 [Candidatus Doudnabacteria bacterium RIFCSPLOWO2_01_41_7]|nr:MAG: hypothetical protein A3K08_01645 [Candidatus Doudnabacteria bacterium RIFCSPLOWO2_01_41_7]
MKPIYLDYAATTPLDKEVCGAMLPYMEDFFGNASSLHQTGQKAMRALDISREIIAKAIGAKFQEIVCTGSATEANNLALRGAIKRIKSQGLRIKEQQRIIISAIEHDSVLETARGLGLMIIPVVSKIDSPLARKDEVRDELARLLAVDKADVLFVSGRTGEGVEMLLEELIRRIPDPKEDGEGTRALVFDFKYSTHRGIVLYVRVFGGTLEEKGDMQFAATGMRFKVLEVGTLGPGEKPASALRSGEIGYVVTGIKEAGRAVVGDTVTTFLNPVPALPGYKNPQAVVWASLFPESQDDFSGLKLKPFVA